MNIQDWSKEFFTSKRLGSFCWRALMMGVAAALTFGAANLADLNINPAVVGILALILGEASKAAKNAASAE